MTYIFYELSKTRLAPHESLGAANDIVAIGQQAGDICRRVGLHVENVPHILGG